MDLRFIVAYLRNWEISNYGAVTGPVACIVVIYRVSFITPATNAVNDLSVVILGFQRTSDVICYRIEKRYGS